MLYEDDHGVTNINGDLHDIDTYSHGMMNTNRDDRDVHADDYGVRNMTGHHRVVYEDYIVVTNINGDFHDVDTYSYDMGNIYRKEREVHAAEDGFMSLSGHHRVVYEDDHGA